MTAREAIQSRMASITIRRARLDERQVLTELALRSKAHWGYDRVFLDRARPELEFGPPNSCLNFTFTSWRWKAIPRAFAA